MRLDLTSKAQSDRERHYEYVASFSKAAPDRTEQQVERMLFLLQGNPYLGKDRGNDLRQLVVTRTALSLLYRIEADRILVLRILHSVSDWPARF